MSVQWKPYTIATAPKTVVGVTGATKMSNWRGCGAGKLSGWQAAVDHKGRERGGAVREG